MQSVIAFVRHRGLTLFIVQKAAPEIALNKHPKTRACHYHRNQTYQHATKTLSERHPSWNLAILLKECGATCIYICPLVYAEVQILSSAGWVKLTVTLSHSITRLRLHVNRTRTNMTYKLIVERPLSNRS